MKKYLSILLVAALLAAIMFSCKKTSISPAKDYTPSIKDKIWWGMFTATGKDAAYYSVHFNADNTLIWSEFSGDYTGQWTISGKDLTMTLDAGKTEIKAAIGDDDQLLNITGNTGNFVINTGQLVANPNIPLDNTLWEGKPVLATGLYGYQIKFIPALKVTMQETYFYPPSLYKSYLYSDNPYNRSAAGAVIRSSYNNGGAGASSAFFGIIISGSEMRGSIKNYNNQWKATKQ